MISTHHVGEQCSLELRETMFSNVISIVINLLSSVQFLERSEELQKQILTIVRDQINLVLAPPPKVDVVRFHYENEGKVAAIKRWREINDGMSLKYAKDQVEKAATRGEWKDYRVGKHATIIAPNSDYENWTGRVSRVIPNEGFYIKFGSKTHDIFFHSSAVRVQM